MNISNNRTALECGVHQRLGQRRPDSFLEIAQKRKKKPPTAVARSRRRIARFLERKSVGKPDFASPEDKQSITAVPRSRAQEPDSALSAKPKELENINLTCGRKKNSVSLDNQKQPKASESDIDMSEQAILQDFRNTLSKSEVNSDDSVDVSSLLVNNV